MAIRRITIVGTGLIGGSLGLALRQREFDGTIVGCDKADVLAVAVQRQAVDRGEADLAAATEGSDVVVLATSVGTILSLFERLAPTLSSETLIADTGSTKERLAERARMVLGASAADRVLPGHPMAGKEHGGIENAEPDLFRGAAWVITPVAADHQYTARQQEFVDLLQSLGARTVVMDAERHDRLCAWVSHLPQMMATALGSVLRDEFGDDQQVAELGGRALREMTRIAASPYSMWRDVALTNSQNLEDVLLRMEQQLAYLRENLRGPGLRELFESANQFARGPARRNDP